MQAMHWMQLINLKKVMDNADQCMLQLALTRTFLSQKGGTTFYGYRIGMVEKKEIILIMVH